MQQEALFPEFASALLFETPAQIYTRVFRQLRPVGAVPAVEVAYCEFANVRSTIRMEGNRIEVRISDVLRDAPAPVTEALAFILLGKMLRKAIPKGYAHRYKLYLNRKEVRRQTTLVRQLRGRKQLSAPQGRYFDLEEMFNRLNTEYFSGLLAKPALGWSLRRSRTMLGHFDPSHNAIILSRIFDEPKVPALAVEYVMYHEMLHLQYPVEHRGARRCVHTPEFKEAERRFPRLKEAKDALKRLTRADSRDN